MKGRTFARLACVAFALAIGVSPVLAAKHVAKPAGAAATKSAKSRNALHQFTGTVTALEKTGFTVEKGGKKPRTMVFVKHDAMATVGDLAKDVRVTVYYRDDGGRTIAHKVVVKEPATASAR